MCVCVCVFVVYAIRQRFSCSASSFVFFFRPFHFLPFPLIFLPLRYHYSELAKLVIEAKDNVKFLTTLERHFKNISMGDMNSIIDTLPSMMNAIRMVWIISRHYITDERMVPLNKMVKCNTMFVSTTFFFASFAHPGICASSYSSFLHLDKYFQK